MKQFSITRLGEGRLRHVTRIGLLLSVMLVGAISAQAQVTTGTIRGVVSDQAGGLFPVHR